MPTLPAALSAAGYDTYSVGKLHLTCGLAEADSGHGESFAAWREGALTADWQGPYYGFDRVELTLGHADFPLQPWAGHYGYWLREHHPEVFEMTGVERAPEPKWSDCYRSPVPPEAYHSSYIATRIIDYLRSRDGSGPFFIFGGFPDPHHNFVAVEAYARQFDRAAFPPPRAREGEHAERPGFYARIADDGLFECDGNCRRPPGGEHMRHILQNTYAMVSLIDHNVGRVLDEINRLGLSRETIVCFTSDHGDFLGDHGLLHKGQVPFASLMRVPFLLRAPGIPPGALDAPIGNADVMPTLMELAGLEAPQTCQGLSQAAVFRRERTQVQEAAYSCGWAKNFPHLRHMSLHSPTHRITWWPRLAEGELYDLTRDPDEFENRWRDPGYAETRDRLMRSLLDRNAYAGPVETRILCPW